MLVTTLVVRQRLHDLAALQFTGVLTLGRSLMCVATLAVRQPLHNQATLQSTIVLTLATCSDRSMLLPSVWIVVG